MTGPKAGLSGQHFANFSKVVRMRHVSEVRATRVGVRPGEGSAGAACRKMRYENAFVGFAAVALFLAGCGERDTDREGSFSAKHISASEVKNVDEFVSKTIGAKIYPQPPQNSQIVLKNIGDRSALVDMQTGDMLLSQEADRERRIMYFAYVTKDRKLVRVFMTQWGGGSYGRRWKTYPIRLWNTEEAKITTPEVVEARSRATISKFAQFLSSWPDFKGKDRFFMIIDAPVSETDPL